MDIVNLYSAFARDHDFRLLTLHDDVRGQAQSLAHGETHWNNLYNSYIEGNPKQNDDGPPDPNYSPYVLGLYHYLTNRLGTPISPLSMCSNV